MERLQKVLAAHGVASRRRAEELIAAGQVTVNGALARVGQSVTTDDVIEVAGHRLGAQQAALYLALHKPSGFVSSLRSTHGERTVTELVGFGVRMFPVGRLDKETSGLLFLTNDGEWANLISHPRYQIEKEYDVLVQGTPSSEAVRRMRDGLQLPGGDVTAPARVHKGASLADRTHLSVTVIEGKKRQIRLMAAAVGHPVLRLRRVRIGPIPLAELEEGRWRNLRPEEVESIRAQARLAATSRSQTVGPGDD